MVHTPVKHIRKSLSGCAWSYTQHDCAWHLPLPKRIPDRWPCGIIDSCHAP